MRFIFTMSLFFLLYILFSSSLFAQDNPKKNNEKTKTKTEVKTKIQHGYGFVDADGDGYNDNAPDHDGDGIPNGIDPDYHGAKHKKRFVDIDGDGINDNAVLGKRKGNNKNFKNNDFDKKGNGPQRGNVRGTDQNNPQPRGAQSRTPKGKGKGKGGQ